MADATPCARCGGTPHLTRWGTPACTGHSKTTKRPCTAPPMRGQDVCRMHGGAARQNRAAGQRRVAEQAAERAVRTLGLPVDITPTDALLEEVRWTAGHVAWLREKVQELRPKTDPAVDPDDDGEAELPSRHPDHARHGLTWGTTQVVHKRSGEFPGTDTTEAAGPSVWYELYHRERQHLVVVSQAAIRAGVEERRVRLAEQQGQIAVELIRRILDALYAALVASGISEDLLRAAWAAAVEEVVPREIRAMDALTRGETR